MDTFKNRLLSLIGLAVVVSCFSIAQEKQIAAGQEALKNGDYLKAIEQFREATDKDKKNGQAFLLLGQALYAADSLDAANVALFQAKELEATNPAIYELLGDVYAKQRIWKAALEQYTKAYEMDSSKVPLMMKIADGYKKIRDYNPARTMYVRIISRDSNNVTALRELGSIYYRAKQLVAALPYIEKLAKIYADSSEYQIKYAHCLAAAHRWKDLIPVGRPLVEKDASLADVQGILDSAYAILGMNEEIIRSYKDRKLESLKIEDLIRYVKALQSQQIYDTAEIVYKIIFRKDSSRCDMRYPFGTNEMKLKKWTDAVTQFEKKIECDTSAGYQFASHLNAAMSLMQLKRFNDALQHTKKAIELRPDNVQAWVILAECYGQLDQISEEIAAYKKVIDLATAANTNGDEGKYNPQLQEAYRMIGVRLLIEATKDKNPETNRPKYKDATKYLDNAIALNPKDCQALLWCGQAYQNANDKDKAKARYRTLLERCPNAKEAEDGKKGLAALGEK